MTRAEARRRQIEVIKAADLTAINPQAAGAGAGGAGGVAGGAVAAVASTGVAAVASTGPGLGGGGLHLVDIGPSSTLNVFQRDSAMTVDQLGQLYHQMTLHVQLLSQIYAMTAKDPVDQAQSISSHVSSHNNIIITPPQHPHPHPYPPSLTPFISPPSLSL